MTGLYIVAVGAFILSAIFDGKKTKKAVKIGWKKFNKILPNYLKLLIILSFVLLVSDKFIIKYLGETSTSIGLLLSLVLGSITMMPGFIAYPLAGILVDKGVSYMIVAGFITTLMMVGVATYPVEKQYFGRKATILRNIVGFSIAFVIAIATGLLYGEVL